MFSLMFSLVFSLMFSIFLDFTNWFVTDRHSSPNARDATASKKYKKFYKSRVIYHILCLKHFGLLSGSFTVNLLFHWAKIDFQNVTFIFTSFVQFFIILICDLLWYFYSRTINFLFFPFCSSVLEPYFNLLLRHTKFSKKQEYLNIHMWTLND